MVHTLKKKAELWDLLATTLGLFGEIQISNIWCVCVCVFVRCQGRLVDAQHPGVCEQVHKHLQCTKGKRKVARSHGSKNQAAWDKISVFPTSRLCFSAYPILPWADLL